MDRQEAKKVIEQTNLPPRAWVSKASPHQAHRSPATAPRAYEENYYETVMLFYRHPRGKLATILQEDMAWLDPKNSR